MSFSTNSNTKKHISCYNSNPITVSSLTLLSIELLDCKVSEMLQLRNHENQSLLHYVQRMLDPLEKLTKKNWRSVGQILNVSEEDLDLIEIDYKAGRSPTVSLIDKLSTFPIVPSMRSFVEALVSCKRYDVATNICNWPWELRTIQWGKLFSKLEGRNN